MPDTTATVIAVRAEYRYGTLRVDNSVAEPGDGTTPSEVRSV
ncbi:MULTISPECIES: hypothetical protein [unclassified Mycolicibacterium]|uniref:Uncharacterized protein n=1 Tax=Mycolicibacterium sp. CBMA 213 TaxID=1968788 RepID=A0A343VRP1_9MYCO|nr:MULTISPECIES: hypothetical protein [unclassified Mycolicibacterium]AVN58565.1 hypothetical protein B5P44_p00270 [Mycolicibacterium sp. CBMA 213]